MMRDMDLVRKILFSLEAEPQGYHKGQLRIDGYPNEEINYHVFLMGEAGLLAVINMTHLGSSSPEAMPLNLTWWGHDFLDACRDEGRWNRAKEIFAQMGGVTFDVAKQVLVSLLQAQVTQAVIR
jgi:hypothetical protein